MILIFISRSMPCSHEAACCAGWVAWGMAFEKVRDDALVQRWGTRMADIGIGERVFRKTCDLVLALVERETLIGDDGPELFDELFLIHGATRRSSLSVQQRDQQTTVG
jgi:hypothetical protein